MITDQIVLEALAVSADPIHAIQRDEPITLGDDKCRTVTLNELV